MDPKQQRESLTNGGATKSSATTIGVSEENGYAEGIEPYLGLGLTPPSQSYLGSTPPQSFRRRCDSVPSNEDGDQNESKVLVIYTGGTIGMIRNDDNSKQIIYDND